MPLTLSDIAENPTLLTYRMILPSGEAVTLRPLEHTDEKMLALFFAHLSPQTEEYYERTSPEALSAQEMCDAINRYDKLRFIVEEDATKKVIALFEFSFDPTEDDKGRFAGYGMPLNPQYDYRMGPCIADEYQNKGIGSFFFPYLADISKQCGKKRMILWGGVFPENKRALRFYEKCGFKQLGRWKNEEGKECIDMIVEMP